MSKTFYSFGPHLDPKNVWKDLEHLKYPMRWPEDDDICFFCGKKREPPDPDTKWPWKEDTS